MIIKWSSQTQELANNYWLFFWLMDGSHGHVSTQGGPFGAFRVPIKLFIDSRTPHLPIIIIKRRFVDNKSQNTSCFVLKLECWKKKKKTPDAAPGTQTEHVHPPNQFFNEIQHKINFIEQMYQIKHVSKSLFLSLHLLGEFDDMFVDQHGSDRLGADNEAEVWLTNWKETPPI